MPLYFLNKKKLKNKEMQFFKSEKSKKKRKKKETGICYEVCSHLRLIIRDC